MYKKVILVLLSLFIVSTVYAVNIQIKLNNLEENNINVSNEYFRDAMTYVEKELEKAIEVYESEAMKESDKTFYLNSIGDGIEMALKNVPRDLNNAIYGLNHIYNGEFDEEAYLILVNLVNKLEETSNEFIDDALEKKQGEFETGEYNKIFAEHYSDPEFVEEIIQIINFSN